MKLRKLACTLPNQLYLQYFILLLFSSLASSLPFHFFFSLLFSHPHTSSHTLLSFKFPLIFVITCCLPLSSTFFPLCASSSTYQLPVLHLIWLFSTSHSSFSLSHRGFFVLLYFFCKVLLFISFLSSSIFFFFFWLRF